MGSTMGMFSRLAAVGAAIWLVSFAAPGSAGAAVITPNILTDEDTANTDCSLREAVTAANTGGDYKGCNPGGADDDADTIVLQSGMTYDLSIAGVENANASGDLDILSEELTIQTSGAARATIDANGDGSDDPVAATGDRVIHNGVFPNLSPSLTLTNVALTDGLGADAGGIRHDYAGSLTITDSKIFNNRTSGAGIAGAMRLDGGPTTIIDSEINTNSAPTVGGIWTEATPLTIAGSTISGNQATHIGTSGNGKAGGLYINPAVPVSVTNSTISGNSSKTDAGGIYNNGTLTLSNSTVAGNTADSDTVGATFEAGDGGGIFANAGTLTARNSIIANNLDASGAGNVHPDCSGTVTSQGYNLIESTAGCTGTTGTDLTGQDPALDALDANGGPTDVQALLATSPAINAGNPAPPGSGVPACEAADQRGQLRGGVALTCDIGAFEGQPVTLNAIGNKSVQAGQNLSFVASATDPDPFDALTFSASNLPAGASFTPATRTFSWTPSASQVGGHPNVGFAVSDGTYNDNETIAITVTPIPQGSSATTTPKKKCKKKKKRAAAAAKKKKCKKKRK